MLERIKQLFVCQKGEPMQPMGIGKTVYPDGNVTFNEYTKHISEQSKLKKNENNNRTAH